MTRNTSEVSRSTRRGEAKLGEKKVDIISPDPIGELGSGEKKIAAGLVESVTVGRS